MTIKKFLDKEHVILDTTSIGVGYRANLKDLGWVDPSTSNSDTIELMPDIIETNFDDGDTTLYCDGFKEGTALYSGGDIKLVIDMWT